MALIDVPPSSLWEIIGNCDLYKGNLPNVVEAKLIKMVKKFGVPEPNSASGVN